MSSKASIKEDAVAWATGLTDKQFVEFVYDVCSRRKGEENFVLVDSRWLEDEGEWGHQFIGRHSPEAYPGGWDDTAPLCQFGQCSDCGVDIISWAKKALCPVCGEQVHCT